LRLAIVSQSARIYAEMANREGFEVLAIDAFADVDTLAAAEEVWRLPALCEQLNAADAKALITKLDAWQPDFVLIGSGFEADADCYASLYKRFALPGNAPEVIKQVKNPFWLKAHCVNRHVRTPEVLSQAPQNGRWLYKIAGQSGGAHVSDWNETSVLNAANGYWQAFQSGQPVGALFVVSKNSIKLIGVHALKQRPEKYTYAGASRLHDEKLTQAMQELLDAVVPDSGLIGINSLDAIWQDGRLHVLEINPRLSASMRLYIELPLIQSQLASCQGTEIPELNVYKTHASHCIAYAKQTLEINQAELPTWLEDRPENGTIKRGEPVCSLYAEGPSKDAVQQILQDKKTQLKKLWGTYVCEHIEFNIH
jgi:uncharacterized protein